jgi:hypothetical protein
MVGEGESIAWQLSARKFEQTKNPLGSFQAGFFSIALI